MLTDAELVDGVVAGYDDAFAELYERHSLAAWRLGQTVTGNPDDAADAVSEAFAKVLVAVRAGHLDKGGSFRSYLLTATRNAALDNIRKTSRTKPTDQEHLSEVVSTSPTPSEHLSHDEEAALVAEAFRNLPERWRSVLWLTEVEGVATKDAAQRLGLSPNGAAQLAVRARSGLRERFLQAHLRKTVDPQCRTTVDRLGAYVGGGLSPRDLAKVDQHLAGCPSCEVRRKELEDVGTCLRRAAVPVPLALVGGLGAAGSPMLFGLGAKLTKAAAWAQEAWVSKAAAAAAAGMIAVGAGGAYMAGSDQEQAMTNPAAVVVVDQAAGSAPAPGSPEIAPPGATTDPAATTDDVAPTTPAPMPVEPSAGSADGECITTGLERRPGARPLEAVAAGSPAGGGTDSDTQREAAPSDAEPRVTIGVLDRNDPEPSIELEVPLGDATARLAAAADLAAGRGLDVDLGLADRGERPGGCAGNVEAGLAVGADGTVTPELEAERPS